MANVAVLKSCIASHVAVDVGCGNPIVN